MIDHSRYDQMDKGKSQSTLGGLALGITVFCVAWIVLYIFAPIFVCYQVTDTGSDDHSKPDPARCLVYSLLAVIVILIVFYLLRSCVDR